MAHLRLQLCTLLIACPVLLLPACSDDTPGSDASGTAETGDGDGDGDGDPGACGMPGAILCTTLEDGAAITNPAAGDGTGATWQTNPVDDFLAGQIGNGINIDGADEFVRFRQLGAMNAPANINTPMGTIEFWYLPLYSSNDGLNHHLFATTEDFGNGGMRARKAAANNSNNFQVVTVDENGSFVGELQIAPQDTPFAPGNWVKVRVTWDFTVGNNTQCVRVYFDDVEPPYVSAPMGPATLPPPEPTEHVWIGAWTANDQETATGVIDEFAIYDQVLVP